MNQQNKSEGTTPQAEPTAAEFCDDMIANLKHNVGKARAVAPVETTRSTRFDEFDDEAHPCNQWWEKHGQFMLSGGGRREFIWACRGWIAREQYGEGAKVTGESMHEAHVS